MSVVHPAPSKRETEKRLQGNWSDRVLVALPKDWWLDLPLGFAGRSVTACTMWQTFLLEGVAPGMGFGKCGMAEPAENVSQER